MAHLWRKIYSKEVHYIDTSGICDILGGALPKKRKILTIITTVSLHTKQVLLNEWIFLKKERHQGILEVATVLDPTIVK